MSNSNINSQYADPNMTPPLGEASALGLQHVLAMFASNVTPSVIVAGAAGLAFGGAESDAVAATIVVYSIAPASSNVF